MPSNLVERAYYHFYYFALIVIMNKRLTFMPTANFVVRSTFNFARRSVAYSLALHTSPLLLPGIDCGQATSTTGSEVDASLSRPEYLIRVSTGLNLIQSASHDSSAPLSLRRWKPDALRRRCDMWINGSDIRFMHRILPEMKYMFHALYTHAPDRAPGHVTTCNSVLTPEPLIYVPRLSTIEAQ